MAVCHLCQGDDLCSWGPTAYPGQAVFLAAPHPTHAWATPCPSACWLTKQFLAVQLLSVEGAGPIEQSVVFGVHCLNLI